MFITVSFEKLLIYIGFTLSLCAMLTVAGMIILRKTRPELERSYKTLGYPVTPLLFILIFFDYTAYTVYLDNFISPNISINYGAEST